MSTPTNTTPLPDVVAFPSEGTEEFNRFIDSAREGWILLGPEDSGRETLWDMRRSSNALIVGPTGCGKTAAVSIPVLAALLCPETFDVAILACAGGDFEWAAEFANVECYTSRQEISEYIMRLADDNRSRHRRLRHRNAHNLRELREMYTRDPELEAQDGWVPRRRLVVVDGYSDLDLTDQAHCELDFLLCVSRAVEINFLVTAEEFTQIPAPRRGFFGTLLIAGTADVRSLERIFDDQAAALMSKEVWPTGRMWYSDGYGSPQQTQIAYLPMRAEAAPWESAIRLAGAYDITARRHRGTK